MMARLAVAQFAVFEAALPRVRTPFALLFGVGNRGLLPVVKKTTGKFQQVPRVQAADKMWR